MIDLLDEIYAALSLPIKTAVQASLLPLVNWENEGFNVVEGTPYLEAQNFIQDIGNDEVGKDAPSRVDGFFQVNVRVPSGIGTKMSSGYVAVVRSLFKKGSILTTTSGYVIHIIKTAPAGAVSEKDWYIVPVTTYYYLFA